MLRGSGSPPRLSQAGLLKGDVLLPQICRSVVVEGKSANAAFVPFRLVNYLAPGAAQIGAAVAEVVELICQEDKYESGASRGRCCACCRCRLCSGRGRRDRRRGRTRPGGAWSRAPGRGGR